MSEFMRSTVYLYLYEKGLPIKNIGFIKRNIYGEEDKLTLHLKGLYTTKRERGEIFALREAESRYHCEPIGEIFVENSTGETRLTIKHDEKCKGVMIHIAEKICMAGFDDEKIDIKMVEFASEQDVSTKAENVRTEEKKTEETKREGAESEDVKVEVPQIEAVQAEIAQAETVRAEAVLEEATTEAHTESETTENAVKSEISEVEQVWNKLARVFPTVHPFEHTVDAEYLSITPSELQFFNKKATQALMSNSFLQHAYYSYRYIILGREQAGDKEISYHVGVPGTYHEREVMMANMFGFEGFKCAKKEETAQGCFGYYIKNICQAD